MQTSNVLLTFLTCFHYATTAVVSASPIKDYPTPKDCVAFYVVDRTGVALECQVPVISYETSGVNFSAIASEFTLSLMVTCTFTAWSMESSFDNVSLNHLKELKELIFSQCNFHVLPQESFDGQTSTLKYLTVNRNVGRYDVPFDVRRGSLRHLAQLQTLEITDSNLVDLPTDELCPLSNLQSLNFSFNAMSELEFLGFSSENTETCAMSLISLELSFNNYTAIRNGSFAKLVNLQFLRLQGNRITELETMAFSNLTSLILLDLSQNFMKSLTENLWVDCSQLLALNLSLNAIAGTVDRTTFRHLRQLIVLDLSSNTIEAIEPDSFSHLTHLMELYIASNNIIAIRDDTFSKQANLIALDLSRNRIEQVSGKNLDGLTTLTILWLNKNNITTVEPNLFQCCLEITNLNLSSNRLTSLPRIEILKNLQVLDVSFNRIGNLDNATFSGLFQLLGISFKSNVLEELDGDTFVDLRALQILNLGENRISVLQTGVLERNTKLTTLDLNDNVLREHPNLQTLENLIYLDLSNNLLTKLDYGMLPKNLTFLDIHRNRLKTVEDRFRASEDVKINVLLASDNQLTAINSKSFPPTSKIIDLSKNNLSSIQIGTFANMPDLETVDLTYNQFKTFNKDALLIKKTPTFRRPRFFLQGNFPSCDCTMNWLKYINEDFTSQQSSYIRLYATVYDLKNIYCWTVPIIGNSSRAVSLVVNVANDQFVCRFKEHEFSDPLCYTQIPNRKVCKVVCPERCSCYHDEAWNNVVTYCSQSNQTTVPTNIPVTTKTFYLDGNNIAKLTNSSFDVLMLLEWLYLNATALRTIEKDAFIGLSSLRDLHLEKNALQQLGKGTFNGMSHLLALDLSWNGLVLIEEQVFEPLRSLNTLKLNGNRLTDFPVWTLKAMPKLAAMSLAENPWSCECDYMETYRQWLQAYADKVIDMEQLFCEPEGGNDSALIPMIAFNASYCFNATYVEHSSIVRYIPVLVGVTLAFIAICMISILIFLYHKEMQVLIYSRYGVRLFHCDEENSDEAKPYDAFVSYSNLDEEFLVNELLPKLERIEFPYHLCLHHRNFLPGAFIMDSIVQAVASSKRTVLLLSENFIQSEWCRLEFKSAHHQMLKDRCNRVIVVVLGKIPDKLDPEMKLYMKTNTYLQWGDRLFWEKLYFALPNVPRRTDAGK